MFFINDSHLNKIDGGAAGVAFLSFFKVIPWPEISAFLAAVYMFLRLLGLIGKWWKQRK